MKPKVMLLIAALALACTGLAHAQERQPNILVIWGDDIGIAYISAYSNGLMGYETPNIGRIAREDDIRDEQRGKGK